MTDPNRRKFLLGGGFLAIVPALAAITLKEASPAGSKRLCKDHHEPIEAYITHSAIAIGNTNDPARSLVPCKNCGVLFGITINPNQKLRTI